jgi:hypothetical protein
MKFCGSLFIDQDDLICLSPTRDGNHYIRLGDASIHATENHLFDLFKRLGSYLYKLRDERNELPVPDPFVARWGEEVDREMASADDTLRFSTQLAKSEREFSVDTDELLQSLLASSFDGERGA